MTNSQVLQLIIEELSQTNLTWESDKELFELICAPVSYGNDNYQQRKFAKKIISDIFAYENSFDKKKFDSFANNIICGENQEKHKKELLDFLNQQMTLLNISTEKNLNNLIDDIPCKSEDEKNYKNSFNNWKNGKTERINCRKIKQRLEQNFDFPPSLWDKGEIFIKTTIRDGVERFVKQRINEISSKFDDYRKEYDMKTIITDSELKELEKIKHMSQTKLMEFIAKQYPLEKHYSQEFIQKMIPILYTKGYYELLLKDIITSLDVHLQETKQVKKIKAHILGTSVIGEYKKAFDLLSTIVSDDDKEIIDMQTEALSNMRRHQLNYTKLNKEEKKEIIKKLISHYQEVFEHNKTYHYYPAINLVYMLVISSIDNPKEQNMLKSTIFSIHEKTKPSILSEKNSKDQKERYYAHITELEFLLLKDTRSPIAELERYLEMNDDDIPLSELGRTQRQMQFFVDTVINLYGYNSDMIEKMQRAIEVIDDFIEYKNE